MLVSEAKQQAIEDHTLHLQIWWCQEYHELMETSMQGR